MTLLRRVHLVCLVMLVAVMGAVQPANGESTTCGEVQIPIERLVSNLETRVRANPADGQAFLNLARIHAAAFARKSPTQLACPSTSEPVPAHESQVYVQPDVVSPADAQQRRLAETHLREAVRNYERAIALLPRNAFGWLGYAWTLQQSGRVSDAIRAYRETILLAWPADREANERRVNPDGTSVFTLGPLSGTRFVTEEAARFLIPLLDAKKDEAEIATLRERSAFIAKGPRGISPIVIPLRAEAKLADLINPSACVMFDLDGFGARTWTWITPDAGWLVYDPRGTGRITSGLQLFGNVTFWLFWNTGYDALQALDDDGNGVLRGAELAGLAVWRDENADGVSQPGEVRSLASFGIVELSTRHVVEDEDDDVLAHAPNGVRFSDGSTRTTYDVLLHAREATK